MTESFRYDNLDRLDTVTLDHRTLSVMTQLLDDQQTTISKVYVGNCEFIDGPDRLRNPTTWSGSFTGTPKFDRGFTGHEHLYALSEEGSTMTHTVLVREVETRLHMTWGHNASWEYVNKIWFQDPRIGYLNGTPIIGVNRILNAFVIR